MDVQWSSLGEVLATSLGATVAVVVMFSLGIVARARAGPGGVRRPVPRTRPERLALAVAALCFAGCLATAAYGIGLIVPG